MTSPTQIILCTIPFHGKAIVISLWTVIGFLGNILFTSRVITQWWASQKAGEILIPISFWWMSFVATLIMMVYAMGLHQLPLVLNSAITIIPYIRNIAIYYRPNRPPRNTVLIAAIAMVLLLSALFMFWRKYYGQLSGAHAQLSPAWFVFGLIACGVYSSRFLVQWIQSERRRASYMGLSFWYISLVGGLLFLAFSLKIRDLPFIIGFMFTVIPNVLNLRIIYKQRARQQAALAGA